MGVGRSLVIASTAALVAADPQAPAQSGAITGVKVSVIEKAGIELRVTVENQRDSPIVECSIDFPGAADYDSREPVDPHARRTMSVRIDEARTATRPATLDYVVFDDGYYEGNGRLFDQWLADRSDRIEDPRSSRF